MRAQDPTVGGKCMSRHWAVTSRTSGRVSQLSRNTGVSQTDVTAQTDRDRGELGNVQFTEPGHRPKRAQKTRQLVSVQFPATSGIVEANA